MDHRISLALVSLILFASLLFSASTVKLTMYPDSNTYVLRTYSFANSGPFTLEPKEIMGVSPSSISAFGDGADPYFISQYEVNRTRQEQKSLTDLLNESVGKKIAVKTAAGSYNATLQWYDGSYIGLQDTGGFHLISLSSITDLSVPSTSALKDVNYTEDALSVFGSASKANGALTFGYAKHDLSWNIDYDLVVANGDGTLKEYSTLSNTGDEAYDNADLTLTMLNPNFVSTSGGYYYNYATKSAPLYESAAGTSAPSPTPPVFTTYSKSGVWSYRPSTPITIPAHSTQKVVVFTDKATYTKKSLWDISRGSTVYRVYELNNSRKEVLPSGTVHVFDNGAFVGEDTVDMLGSKASKELFVSDLPQYEVEKVTLSDDVTGNSITKFIHTVKVRLTVKNHGDTKDELEVREDLSGYSDFKYLSYSVQPFKVDGGKAYWKLPVSAGAEQDIEYTYTYSSTY